VKNSKLAREIAAVGVGALASAMIVMIGCFITKDLGKITDTGLNPDEDRPHRELWRYFNDELLTKYRGLNADGKALVDDYDDNVPEHENSMEWIRSHTSSLLTYMERYGL
jgi:hypothetical protein